MEGTRIAKFRTLSQSYNQGCKTGCWNSTVHSIKASMRNFHWVCAQEAYIERLTAGIIMDQG